MFIESAVKEFLVNCSIKSYSKRTIKSYRNNLTRFFSFVSEKEIKQIDSAKIKQQISELQNKGLKASYINNLIKTLRAFCSYLIEQEYITVNPMKKVPWCKERIVLIKAFSDDEVKQMMSAYSEKDFMEMRNKTIMALLFDTGIRCFELCSVCNDSIKDNYITIAGKENKERIAAISPPLHKLMLKYVRMRDKYFSGKTVHCNNFFLSRTGRPLTNAAVERIVRIAGEIA